MRVGGAVLFECVATSGDRECHYADEKEEEEGEGLCEGVHYTELVRIEGTWIVDIYISGVALGFST